MATSCPGGMQSGRDETLQVTHDDGGYRMSHGYTRAMMTGHKAEDPCGLFLHLKSFLVN